MQGEAGSETHYGEPLAAGDAMKVTGSTRLVLENGEDAEVLVFDLPL